MKSVPCGDPDTLDFSMTGFMVEIEWAWSFLQWNTIGFGVCIDHIVPFGGLDRCSSELDAVVTWRGVHGIVSIPSFGGFRSANLHVSPLVAISVNLAFAIFNGHTMGFGSFCKVIDLLMGTSSTLTTTICVDMD